MFCFENAMPGKSLRKLGSRIMRQPVCEKCSLMISQLGILLLGQWPPTTIVCTILFKQHCKTLKIAIMFVQVTVETMQYELCGNPSVKKQNDQPARHSIAWTADHQLVSLTFIFLCHQFRDKEGFSNERVSLVHSDPNHFALRGKLLEASLSDRPSSVVTR